MLKKLITQIKSESDKSTHKSNSNTAYIPKYSLSQPYILKITPTYISSIHTLQYLVIPDFPDLKNLILSCPIPFHTLPHSQRRVKQIDLFIDYPQYMKFIIKAFQKYLYNPNHVLINHYPKGVGIMHHLDGPLYYPSVLVYSIGTAIIEFIKQGQKKKVLLQDKSLHIFKDEAYLQYQHGIQNYAIDCIFIKLEFRQECIELVNSSVINFGESRIFDRMKSKLNKDLEIQQIDKYEISKVYQNEQYNYKLSIQRTDRISLTIRHKYEIFQLNN